MENKRLATRLERGIGFLGAFLLGISAVGLLAEAGGEASICAWGCLCFSLLLFLTCGHLDLRWFQALIFGALVPIQVWHQPWGFGAFAFAMISIFFLFRSGIFMTDGRIKGLVLFGVLAFAIVVPAWIAAPGPRTLITSVGELVALGLAIQAIVNSRTLAFLATSKGTLDLRTFGLTDRECEFSLAVARGMRLKEISRHFFVSDSTVRNTLNDAYHRLKIVSLQELRALAIRYTIIDGNEKAMPGHERAPPRDPERPRPKAG
jgi:DNA-binding CsgD family transcriptional regulator